MTTLPLEVVALAALLCAALLPAARDVAPRLPWALRTVAVAGAALVVAASVRMVAGTPDPSTADAAPREVHDDGYISSDACRSCHPREYASWHASYHRRMTQRPSAAAVVGDFSDVTVRAGGRAYRLVEEAGAYYAIMIDPRWRGGRGEPPLVRRRIVLTTGSHHQQDYWFETAPPRAIAHLPVAYRVPERRWVPAASTFLRPPYDPDVHRVPETAGWNRNCIQCHATRGVPGLSLPAPVETRVAELGIACEACHGPGAAHVRANRNPRERWRRRRADEGDPTIVNPARLPPERAAMVCGQCHMVSTVGNPARDREWNAHGFAYRPGDDLAATRTIVGQPDVTRRGARGVPDGTGGWNASRFWPDGAIRVTGREYNGLRESGCHTRGELTCSSCHRMHAEGDATALAAWADDQLAPGMDGDAACADCHDQRAGGVAHTRHAPASAGSRCMNCHMPYTTWGLLKAVRSHVVASPDVGRDRAAGRPNACNLCHLDRPLAWAARALERDWGQAAPPLDAVEESVAAAADWLVRGDAGQRALAAWALGWEGAREAAPAVEPWGPALLALALDDSYEAVRFTAWRSLRALGAGAGVRYDHLAPAAERRAARDAVLATIAAPPRAELLIAGDGRLDDTRVARLRGERDERAVLLRE